MMNICTHDEERPNRSNFGKYQNFDGDNFTWEKDYFCKKCNWFIGYYSRTRSNPIRYPTIRGKSQ